MYEFHYHCPSSLEEAQHLFDGAEDGRFIAGGQTLIPTLKQRLAAPTELIDLRGIEDLFGISVQQNIVSIGAMTRHAEVASAMAVRQTIPALARLAGLIGDAQVRNRGTLGGSVSNSDPAADYPAAVVTLNTTVHTHKRAIAGVDFCRGLFETALAEDEILTRIDFQRPTRACYEKFANPASRYAVVGVMVADFDGAIQVGVTGAGACAFRSQALENSLNENLVATAIDAVEIDYSAFNSDLHASAEYRGHLVKVMAKRAVEGLLAQ